MHFDKDGNCFLDTDYEGIDKGDTVKITIDDENGSHDDIGEVVKYFGNGRGGIIYVVKVKNSMEWATKGQLKKISEQGK